MAIGAKPCGARLSRRAEDDHEEEEGEDDLSDHRRKQRVTARRVNAVTIRRKSCRGRKVRLAGSDDEENPCAGDSAEHLGNNVRKEFGSRENACRPKDLRIPQG